MTEPQTAVETYLAARDDLGSTAGSILALHRQDLTEARHAALAEVRRGVEGLPQPPKFMDDSHREPDFWRGVMAGRGHVLRILDAAETP